MCILPNLIVLDLETRHKRYFFTKILRNRIMTLLFISNS